MIGKFLALFHVFFSFAGKDTSRSDVDRELTPEEIDSLLNSLLVYAYVHPNISMSY